ncbi:hypothetical protein [Paenibacillus sp. PCH8]
MAKELGRHPSTICCELE